MRGGAQASGLVMTVLAMLLGAAAWWWLASDRPVAGIVAAPDGAGAVAQPSSAATRGLVAPADMQASGSMGAEATAAAASSVTGRPAEAMGDLQVPAPVAMQRSARHMRGVPADEAPPAPAATDLGGGHVAFGDGTATRGRARLGHGAVTDAEIGLRAPASAVPRPEDSSRVQDGRGSMLTATLYSSEPLDRLAAHYRAQFQAPAGAAVASQESAPAAGQWSISGGDGTAGQRSVMLIQEGAQVRITVTRWQPASAPAAATQAAVPAPTTQPVTRPTTRP